MPQIRSYTPSHVANYFLALSNHESNPLTVLKLLKLCYFGYGWHLGVFGERLFDEPIEAWSHGPVIPSLYHEFKKYGRSPITVRSASLEIRDRTRGKSKAGYDLVFPSIPKRDERAHSTLAWVWKTYSPFDAFALSNLTHRKETPWYKIHGGKPERYGEQIPPNLIARHFRALLRECGGVE